MNTACYLEIGPSTLQVLYGERSLEWPLERLPNGRLTEPCRQQLRLALHDLLPKNAWVRPQVLCAIGARGVSLRRLGVPSTNKDTLHRLLRLQVESEFPLPPEELAWGYQKLGAGQAQNGSPASQEVLIMAVKKDLLADYAQLFPEGGPVPEFTLAALARSQLCPATLGGYALLDLGRTAGEWIQFENGIPTAVRTLNWSGDALTRRLAERLGVSREEAERLQHEGGPPPGQTQNTALEVLDEALDALVSALKEHRPVPRLYLTGPGARQRWVASRLSQRLGGLSCEPLDLRSTRTTSAALAGLQTAAQSGLAPLLFQQEPKPVNGANGHARPAPWKWVAAAALLVAALLALPYLEALLLKPRLARKLAALRADTGRLAVIDQELEFLRDLKQSQSPYLDTLYLMAKSAPMGARIESLSINRRGDLALRGSLKDMQQVADFRSKLIDSGLFATVTIEEQTPTPDRQKLMLRLSAQLKPAVARQNLALGPTPEELEKAKTAKRDQPMGMPGFSPGMGGPPGMRVSMPPGAMPPGAPPPDMIAPRPSPPGAFPGRRAVPPGPGSPGPDHPAVPASPQPVPQ